MMPQRRAAVGGVGFDVYNGALVFSLIFLFIDPFTLRAHMSHTITVLPSNDTFQINSGEFILDAALRQNVILPYGC